MCANAIKIYSSVFLSLDKKNKKICEYIIAPLVGL